MPSDPPPFEEEGPESYTRKKVRVCVKSLSVEST